MKNMKRTPTVAVVIPYYRAKLSPAEQLSLKKWQQFLSGYDSYVVCPSTLSPPLSGLRTKHFEDEYFGSIQGYSRLLLSSHFYEAFAKYDYILIYQLDALVFSDELQKWAEKGWSYIGAPWFRSLIGSMTRSTQELEGGNGGLSLRSVTECLKVLATVKKAATAGPRSRWQQWLSFLWASVTGQTHGKWLQTSAEFYPFNEDGFWSFEASKYSDAFRPAPFEESLAFAFETQPWECYRLHGNQLPFGTHAWEKYDREFWESVTEV
jgi:hypothetical protein